MNTAAVGCLISDTMLQVASSARMSIGFGLVTRIEAVETSKAVLIAGAEWGGVSIITISAPRFRKSVSTVANRFDPRAMTAGTSIRAEVR